MIDKTTEPASLISLTLNSSQKEHILKLGPCHPLESILCHINQAIDTAPRHCFNINSDGSKMQSVSYSMAKNAIFLEFHVYLCHINQAIDTAPRHCFNINSDGSKMQSVSYSMAKNAIFLEFHVYSY